MDFIDRVLENPLGVLRDKPWWQIALIALPWALLVIVLWLFFGGFPGKLTPDYKNQAKNKPLDEILDKAEKKAKNLEKERLEITAKTKILESRLTQTDIEFEELKTSLKKENDHKKLTDRLYGKKG